MSGGVLTMKRLFKLAVLSACALLLLLAALWGGLQLPATKRFAAKVLSQELSGPGQVMELEGLSGWIPFSLGVERLRVGDAGGTWLELNDAQLDWNPWALLGGRLQVRTLGARRLRLLRLPAPAEPSPSPKDAEPWGPPKRFFPITVERLFLDHLFLDAPVAGEPLMASVQGTVSSRLEEGALEAALNVTGLENAAGTRLSLLALVKPGIPHLSIRLDLSESPAGWVGRRAGIAGDGEVFAQVEAGGDLSRWEGTMAFRAAALGRAHLSFGLDLPRTGVPLEISLQGTAEPSRTLLPEPWIPLLAHPTDLSVLAKRWEDGTLDVASLHLASPALDLSVSGRLRPDSMHVEEVSYRLGVSDLGVLSSLAGLPISGKAAADGTLRGNAKDLEGRTVLTLEDLSLPEFSGQAVRLQACWAVGLGGKGPYPASSVELEGEAHRLVLKHGDPTAVPNLQLVARGRLAPEGELVLEVGHVQIQEMGDMKLSGTADLGKRILQGGFHLDLPSLARFSSLAPQRLEGRLEASGTVEGSWNGFHLKAVLEASDLAYGDIRWKRARVDLDAADLPGSPRGQMTVKADHVHGPLWAETRFAVIDRTVDLSYLDVRYRDAVLRGQVKGEPAALSFTGTLDLSVPRLEQLGDVVGKNLHGSVQARLDLAKDGDRSRAKGNLTATSIRFEDASLDSLRCDLDVARLGPNPQATVRLAGSGLRLPSLFLDKVQAQVEGDGRRLAYSAEWQGKAAASFRADARGFLERDPDRMDLVLERLSGRLADMPFSLERKAVLSPRQKGLELSGLALRLGEGSVRADGLWEPGASRGTLALKDVDLGLVRLLGGPAVEGRVSGQARLTEGASGPQVEAALNVEGIRAPSWDPHSAPEASVRANLFLDARSLGLRGDLEGFAKDPSRLEASFPVRFRLAPFTFRIRGDEPLQGSAELVCDLERVAPLLELDQQRFSGMLKSRLTLSGSWPDPQVDGTMNLAGGRYENEDLGLLVQDVALSVTASQREIRIVDLSARDGLGGRLKGAGTARLEPSGAYPFSLSLTLEEFAPVHRDDVFGKVSGRVVASGSLQDMAVRGELTVQPLQIILPERLPPALTEIEVEEVGKGVSPSKRADAGAAGEKPSRIRLDLSVDFPRRITVRGWGLDSEWKGALNLSGTASDPLITGRFETVRGTLDFLNKRFRVTRGTVQLYGSVPPDPVLDVTAEAPLRELTAVVTITGPASRPSLKLSSTPERPQDEVLAQILFGRSASKLTPFQALRLANTIKALTVGGSSAPGVMDQVRRTLGVDAIELKGADEGLENARLGVGKYITDTVRVEVEQGLGETSGRVGVEVEVTPNISLETDVGGDTGAGVGVQWRIDY